MKNRSRSWVAAMSIFLATPAFAANPFLDAKDDKPVPVNIRGSEWGDEIGGEFPASARMITARIASMSWGAIFKIEFVDLKSRAKKHNALRPQYFIATDDRIILLNEENNDEAAKKISSMDKAPVFEDGLIRGITSGNFKHEDLPWKTTIEVKGDECTYLSSHDSGHYQKFVWKKGVGLIEHASNYGAMREGFSLKRVASKK